MKRVIIILLMLSLAPLASCNKSDHGVTKSYTKYKISSVKWNGGVLGNDNVEETSKEGFFYKNIGMSGTENPKWRIYPRLSLPIYDANKKNVGEFEYVPGHEYILLICIRRWTPDKDLADSHGISYLIEAVLSDEEKDTPMDPEDIIYHTSFIPFGG